MTDKSNGISDNKLKHMLGVARNCKKLAAQRNMTPDMQNACFIMGLLHDIGYENCETDAPTKHPKESYKMICDFEAYKYYILSAIKSHGNKYENLTAFDEILNEADLTTNFDGSEISIEDRIANLQKLYGEDSTHYQHAKKQAEIILLLHGEKS